MGEDLFWDSEEQLKFMLIALAQNTGTPASPGEVVKRARAYYEFVMPAAKAVPLRQVKADG